MALGGRGDPRVEEVRTQIENRVVRRLVDRGKEAADSGPLPSVFTHWPTWMPGLHRSMQEIAAIRGGGDAVSSEKISASIIRHMTPADLEAMGTLSSGARNKRYRTAQDAYAFAVVSTAALFTPAGLLAPVKIAMSLDLLDGIKRSRLGNEVLYNREDYNQQRAAARTSIRRAIKSVKFSEIMQLVTLFAELRVNDRTDGDLPLPEWLTSIRNGPMQLLIRRKATLSLESYLDLQPPPKCR